MDITFHSKFNTEDMVCIITPCRSLETVPYLRPGIIFCKIKKVYFQTNPSTSSPLFTFCYDVETLKFVDLYAGASIILDALDDSIKNMIGIEEDILLTIDELNTRAKVIKDAFDLANRIANAYKNLRSGDVPEGGKNK